MLSYNTVYGRMNAEEKVIRSKAYCLYFIQFSEKS